MSLRRVFLAASITVLSLVLGRALAARAEDDGRPVLDQAVKKSEAAAEATIAAQEGGANAVEAGADQEQEETIREEGKEETQERAEFPAKGRSPAPASGDGLVDQLVQSLGVTRAQAAGGAGAIFSVAKNKLSAGDFGRIASAAPGTDKLLAQAPIAAKGATANEAGGLGGALGGAPVNPGAGGSAAALGGKLGGAEQFGGVASLAGPFSQLGMSPEMAGKFMPVVLEYVGTNGGQEAMTLLAGAFK